MIGSILVITLLVVIPITFVTVFYKSVVKGYYDEDKLFFGEQYEQNDDKEDLR